MGVEAIITVLVGVAAVVGGFFGGKRTGKSQDLTDTATAMAIVREAMTKLEEQNKVKDLLIADLTGRITTLENLVTQRADVDAVKREVEGVRDVVNRIAVKLEA